MREWDTLEATQRTQATAQYAQAGQDVSHIELLVSLFIILTP